jgi:hypothetical protein
MGKLIRKYILYIFIFFLVLVGVGVGFFLKGNSAYKSLSPLNESESKVLIDKVGELVILPEDEMPTIAVVSSPELLKSRPFFADAKKGDQVLIYTNAKKAILYDPSVNKIVNMATLNIGEGINTGAQNIESNFPKTPAQGGEIQF